MVALELRASWPHSSRPLYINSPDPGVIFISGLHCLFPVSTHITATSYVHPPLASHRSICLRVVGVGDRDYEDGQHNWIHVYLNRRTSGCPTSYVEMVKRIGGVFLFHYPR